MENLKIEQKLEAIKRMKKLDIYYKGGFNHYTTLDKLEGKICELLKELPF